MVDFGKLRPLKQIPKQLEEKAGRKVVQPAGGGNFVNGKSGRGPVAALSTLLLQLVKVKVLLCESESKTLKVVNLVVESESEIGE